MWYVFSPRLLPPSQSCFLWPQQSRFGSALPSRREQAEKNSSDINLNWILWGRLCFTLHSKQMFWIASSPLWLLGAFQRRPRPACCLCRSHQPGRIIRKQAFFCSVCWFSNQIRKQTHFFGFSNQLSKLTSLAARFTLQKKLTRLNSPWEKGTMTRDPDASYYTW